MIGLIGGTGFEDPNLFKLKEEKKKLQESIKLHMIMDYKQLLI